MKNTKSFPALSIENMYEQTKSFSGNPSIYVFKTNVCNTAQRHSIIEILTACFPGSEVSLDLGDCDKVLRIKHCGDFANTTINLLNQYGFDCEELVD